MIREYCESDFEAVERIYNLSKSDEFSEESFNVKVTHLSEDEEMLVLFHSSKIYIYESIGIAGFIGVKGNYISWLFVHPKYRSQSIGKKLVSYVLSTLSGEVTLNVARSNIIAKKLYEKLGFEVTKEFTGKYQENFVVVCRMATVKKNG